MAQLSFNYRAKTTDPVEPLGTIVMPYPLADASSGSVDQANAELVVGNQIITPPDIEFDQATNSITVTNNTQETWPPQTDVVVVVPRDDELADDVREVILDHEARITALEGGAPSASAVARRKEREAKAKAKAQALADDKAAKAKALKAKNAKHAKDHKDDD